MLLLRTLKLSAFKDDLFEGQSVLIAGDVRESAAIRTAMKWGPDIRVNGISPGPIAETESMARLVPDSDDHFLIGFGSGGGT